MDLNLIASKLLPFLAALIVLAISYYLPVGLIKTEIRKKGTKPTSGEKLWDCIKTLGLCALFAGVASTYGQDEVSYFVIWFTLSSIPAMLGLLAYFANDAKMSKGERMMDQDAALREQMKDKGFTDEW